jgi:hypothetical protein
VFFFKAIGTIVSLLAMPLYFTGYGKEISVDLTSMKSEEVNKAMEKLVTTQPE